MKSMNLFEDTKSKKKTYTEDFKKKAVELAFKIGVTKAAENLGVSTSSIYSWQKIFDVSTLAKNPLAKNPLTGTLPSAPIQDENGNLTFEIEGNTYTLNVNSKEEREKVKEEVNSNSLIKYNWFKEKTGEEHWVLYNTEMYEVLFGYINFLHYKEGSNLVPVIPINATSCYFMFYCCESLTELDLSCFDTSNVIDMCAMFDGCKSLIQLDLSNFNTSSVTSMSAMLYSCLNLINIYVSDKWNTNSVEYSDDMLKECYSLPGFSPEKIGIEMAKPIEQGGYLTLKK